MAIATLAEIYDNPEVFRGVVKIRKGLACRMILESGDLDGIFGWFNKLAGSIAQRIPPSDPCAARTAEACKNALEYTNPTGKARGWNTSALVAYSVPVIMASAYLYRRFVCLSLKFPKSMAQAHHVLWEAFRHRCCSYYYL